MRLSIVAGYSEAQREKIGIVEQRIRLEFLAKRAKRCFKSGAVVKKTWLLEIGKLAKRSDDIGLLDDLHFYRLKIGKLNRAQRAVETFCSTSNVVHAL